MLYDDLAKHINLAQNSIIICTSCNNNDGVVCVTDYIPFVRSFRFLGYILTRCNAPKLNRS